MEAQYQSLITPETGRLGGRFLGRRKNLIWNVPTQENDGAAQFPPSLRTPTPRVLGSMSIPGRVQAAIQRNKTIFCVHKGALYEWLPPFEAVPPHKVLDLKIPADAPVSMSTTATSIFIAAGKHGSWVYAPNLNAAEVKTSFHLPPFNTVDSVYLKNAARTVFVTTSFPHYLETGNIIVFDTLEGFKKDDKYKLIGTSLKVTTLDSVTFTVTAAATNEGERINGDFGRYVTAAPQPSEIISVSASNGIPAPIMVISTATMHGLMTGQTVTLYNFKPDKICNTPLEITRRSPTEFLIVLPPDIDAKTIEQLPTARYVIASENNLFVYTNSPHQLAAGMTVIPNYSSQDYSVVPTGQTSFLVKGTTTPLTSYTVRKNYAQVQAVGFYGAAKTTSLNGYVINSLPDQETTSPFGQPAGTWQYSAPYNAASYSALDYFNAESSPDAINALWSSASALYLFGPESTEIWQQLQNGSFGRVHEATRSIGCICPESLASDGDVLYFIGITKGGAVGVFAAGAGEISRVDTGNFDLSILNIHAPEEISAACTIDGKSTFYDINTPLATLRLEIATGNVVFHAAPEPQFQNQFTNEFRSYWLPKDNLELWTNRGQEYSKNITVEITTKDFILNNTGGRREIVATITCQKQPTVKCYYSINCGDTFVEMPKSLTKSPPSSSLYSFMGIPPTNLVRFKLEAESNYAMEILQFGVITYADK